MSKSSRVSGLLRELLTAQGGVIENGAAIFPFEDSRFWLVIDPYLWSKSGLRLMVSIGVRSFRHQMLADLIFGGLKHTGYYRAGEEGLLWHRHFFVGAPLGIAIGRPSESGHHLAGSWEDVKSEVEAAIDTSIRNGLPAIRGFCTDECLESLARRSWLGPWDLAVATCRAMLGQLDGALEMLDLGERASTGLMPEEYLVAQSRLSDLYRSGLVGEISRMKTENSDHDRIMAEAVNRIDRIN